jgi:hypothetical protein
MYARCNLNAPVMIGVGGAFDFHTAQGMSSDEIVRRIIG